MSLGKRSGLVAAHWPHLIKAGPAISYVLRTSFSHFFLEESPKYSANGAVVMLGENKIAKYNARISNMKHSKSDKIDETKRACPSSM